MRNQFVILLTTVILITSCEKEETDRVRNYPLIITHEALVDNSGVTLLAEIVDYGQQEILYYGFVWIDVAFGDDYYPTLSDNHVYLNNKLASDFYEYSIKGGLEEGKEYYTRAYLITSKYVIYGNLIRFKSRTDLPSIVDLDPESGGVGDTVFIRAENIALSEKNNRVRLGDKETVSYLLSVFL